jgi:hypothetical protein
MAIDISKMISIRSDVQALYNSWMQLQNEPSRNNWWDFLNNLTKVGSTVFNFAPATYSANISGFLKGVEDIKNDIVKNGYESIKISSVAAVIGNGTDLLGDVIITTKVPALIAIGGALKAVSSAATLVQNNIDPSATLGTPIPKVSTLPFPNLSGYGPNGEKLGDVDISKDGNTSSITTKTSNGGYLKVDTILIKNGAGEVVGKKVVVTGYNSDGTPTEKAEHLYNGNGEYMYGTYAKSIDGGATWDSTTAGGSTTPAPKDLNTFTVIIHALGGATNAGEYSAVEVINNKTGQTQYQIRSVSTGELIASGDNYLVNADNSISVWSGTVKFVSDLSTGKPLYMQDSNGSGLVYGPEGNDIYFSAGSTLVLGANGVLSVSSPTATGGQIDLKIGAGGVLLEKATTEQIAPGVTKIVLEDGAGQLLSITTVQSFADNSRIVTTDTPDGSKKTDTYNTDGTLHQSQREYTSPYGQKIVEIRDGAGGLISNTSTDLFDDGSSIVTVTRPGFSETVTRDSNGNIFQTRTTTQSGTVQTTVIKNAAGEITSTTTKQSFDDGTSLETVTFANGRGYAIAWDNTTEPPTELSRTLINDPGAAWYASAGGQMALFGAGTLKSLILAIRSGDALATASSGFSLAAHVSRYVSQDANGSWSVKQPGGESTELFQLSNVATAVGGLMALRGIQQAFSKGANEGAKFAALGALGASGLQLYKVANSPQWRCTA